MLDIASYSERGSLHPPAAIETEAIPSETGQIAVSRRPLIRELPFCLQCYSTHQRTEDHMFAKYLRGTHIHALAGVISSRKNLAPLCWTHHCHVEKRKKKRFENSGLFGVVNYLGYDYPRDDNPHVRALHNSQLADLFRQIARNITNLNGDAPVDSREDYKRVYDLTLTYAERLKRV
jgi:hypothetical protein